MIFQMHEFELIERISKSLPQSAKFAHLGIGDDCAVLPYSEEQDLLLCSDSLYEGVHFCFEEMSLPEIGYKALAVNLSDIAAMAGQARFATVSLGVPNTLSEQDILDLYGGMNPLLEQFAVEIVGGDTCASPQGLSVHVTLGGFVARGQAKLRSAAQDGHDLWLTGPLGFSRKGKHYRFTPKIVEAQVLSEKASLGAMIDISDGLLSELGHILKQSALRGAVLEQQAIPISKECQREYGDKALEHAMNDGEDFELLFSASPENAHKIEGSAVVCYKIGSIDNRQAGIVLKSGDSLKPLQSEGYNHFL